MPDGGAGNYGWRECVEAAQEVAERLLMDAPNYDAETRLVGADDLLRIVQELNAALAPNWSEQYRLHNMRGSDGPCMCDDCQNERAEVRS